MKKIGWIVLLAFGCSVGGFAAEDTEIHWVDWSKDVFVQAKSANKLVVLDLEAVWCHWCHVMEKETYSDPKIIALMAKNYIAVKVDQDARPDLSKRYEDYGWPATIFFGSDGKELAKRSGYQTKEEMLELMQKLVDKPVPEEATPTRKSAVAESPYLSAEMKKTLLKKHLEQYDKKYGGWGDVHKFLFGASEELALREAWRGKKAEGAQGRTALNKALVLIDPVWGGSYQYSVHNWKQPHFEKIADSQTKNLMLFSLGYALWKDDKYAKAAHAVQSYLDLFLSGPDGGFYTSQDADVVQGKHSDKYFSLSDTKRRKQGIPHVDTHQYARENGAFITGLCALYAATGNTAALTRAVKAAEWILNNRTGENGLFRHDAKDVSGPYLGDTLETGKAFLSLYEVTAERPWLEKARSAGKALSQFVYTVDSKTAGFLPSLGDLGTGLSPEPVREENIEVARFANRLFRFTGDKAFEATALTAMRFLMLPDIADQYPTAGILLADEELSTAPTHLTIVGAKNDPAAKALFLEAVRYPTSYKRVEWWDKAEGDLPSQDVKYPQMKEAAAFACNEGRCSLPVFDPKKLRSKVDRLKDAL